MRGLDRFVVLKQRLQAAFGRLERRERWFLLVGIIFVSGFLVLQGILVPYFNARESLTSAVVKKRQEVLDMALLQQDYEQLKRRQGGIVRQLAQRPSSFSLFTYLESQATAARIKDRVASMRPSIKELDDGFKESVVEMKIELVPLQWLVDFLRRVESEENVVIIKRIAIEQNSRETDLLDVLVTIATFEKL